MLRATRRIHEKDAGIPAPGTSAVRGLRPKLDSRHATDLFCRRPILPAAQSQWGMVLRVHRDPRINFDALHNQGRNVLLKSNWMVRSLRTGARLPAGARECHLVVAVSRYR